MSLIPFAEAMLNASDLAKIGHLAHDADWRN
jgi:hypothetical protein